MKNENPIERYIRNASPQAQSALIKIRAIIKSVIPKPDETITYGIPTFKVDGKYVIYMAGFSKHCSIYPITPAMIKHHGKDIEKYQSGKGTLKFSLDKPLPTAFIKKITATRWKEFKEKNKRP